MVNEQYTRAKNILMEHKESLLRQLKLEGKEDREKLYFHQQLLNDKLPLSIGGGIGQSRLSYLVNVVFYFMKILMPYVFEYRQELVGGIGAEHGDALAAINPCSVGFACCGSGK